MRKWLLSTTVAALIFTGCIPSCGANNNAEAKKLEEFAQELNAYANETYKSKNASCSDYTIKKSNLVSMKDYSFTDKLNIEIKDNKPLIEANLGPSNIILKNDLIDILNSKDLLKNNIDSYIDSCNNLVQVTKTNFSNDTEINKRLYIDNATKDSLINHYKTIDKYRTNEKLAFIKVEELYSFEFPIYKVEYVKEFFDNGVMKDHVTIDYLEVDNKKFFASLKETQTYNRKDFEFYKINNFEQLLLLCRYEQKCIQLKLGTFDKEHNLSFEKIKFMQ